MATKSNLFKGKESYSEELKEAKAIKSGKVSPQRSAKEEVAENSKFAKGGMPPVRLPPQQAGGRPPPQTPTPPPQQAFAKGGMPPVRLPPQQAGGRPPIQTPTPPPQQAFAKGGNVGENRGMSNPMPKAKAMGTLGRAFSKGGYTSVADGVAQRGKTRAQQFKAGGKCK